MVMLVLTGRGWCRGWGTEKIRDRATASGFEPETLHEYRRPGRDHSPLLYYARPPGRVLAALEGSVSGLGG